MAESQVVPMPTRASFRGLKLHYDARDICVLGEYVSIYVDRLHRVYVDAGTISQAGWSILSTHRLWLPGGEPCIVPQPRWAQETEALRAHPLDLHLLCAVNASLEVLQDGRAAVCPDYASAVAEVVSIDDDRTTVGMLYPYMSL